MSVCAHCGACYTGGHVCPTPGTVRTDVFSDRMPAPPFRCPVCEGRGNVPAGFYDRSVFGTSGNPLETCRACNGAGVLR